MPVVNATITSNSFDASVVNSSYDQNVVEVGDDAQAGLVFTNITVPQGTTITSATLTLNQIQNFEGGGSFFVYCEDSNNALAFSPFNGPSDRTPTTAVSTVIPSVDSGLVQVNITTAAQEVFNRAGWLSGNSLGVLLRNRNIQQNSVVFNDFNSGAGILSSIEIVYTNANGLVIANRCSSGISISL